MYENNNCMNDADDRSERFQYYFMMSSVSNQPSIFITTDLAHDLDNYFVQSHGGDC